MVQEGGQDSSEHLNEYSLYQISSKQASKPLQVEVVINGQPLSMELDAGAAMTLVSEETFQHKWFNETLQPSTTMLHTYSGEPLNHHACVFQEGLGILKRYEAQLHIDQQATPEFCRACKDSALCNAGKLYKGGPGIGSLEAVRLCQCGKMKGSLLECQEF